MKEKKLNKKRIVVIGICIIAIIGLIIYINQKANKPLFISSYKNFAWGEEDYGCIIYNNGIIEEYDHCNKEKKLKKGRISNEELKELKVLADSIKDEYEKDISMGRMYDAGTYSKMIYSKKLDKWIELSTYGETMRQNSSEESKTILELVEKMQGKYLK